MKKIKFSKCPIGRHKGEIWEKLQNINTTLPARLTDLSIITTDFLPTKVIQEDTFSDFNKDDFRELMHFFYGVKEIACLFLYFDHPDGQFTTIRSYDTRKHKYYLDSIGQEFKIEVK